MLKHALTLSALMKHKNSPYWALELFLIAIHCIVFRNFSQKGVWKSCGSVLWTPISNRKFTQWDFTVLLKSIPVDSHFSIYGQKLYFILKQHKWNWRKCDLNLPKTELFCFCQNMQAVLKFVTKIYVSSCFKMERNKQK